MLGSVPPDLLPSAESAHAQALRGSSGGQHRHQAAAQLLTNPAEVLDAQEAVKISMERITCATTVRP